MGSTSNDQGVAADALVESALTRAITDLKGTYSFTRKISDGNYGSSDHFLSVQFGYAPDATAEEFLSEARDAAFKAKSIVYEQAGIEAHLDDLGILREVVQRHFPGTTPERQTTTVVNGDETESVSTGGDAVGPNPPNDPDDVRAMDPGPAKKAAQRANSDWARARYGTHPNEFWDNTTNKKYPNSPDYAHKTHKGVGFWVD